MFINNNAETELKEIIDLFNWLVENDCAIPGEELFERDLIHFKDFFCQNVDTTISMIEKLDFTGKDNVILLYSPYIVDGLQTQEDKEKFIHALERLREEKNYLNNQDVQGLFEDAIANCYGLL